MRPCPNLRAKSADLKITLPMMSLEATRYLWSARLDPRRRSYAVGTFVHVLDQWAEVALVLRFRSSRQRPPVAGIARPRAGIDLEDRHRGPVVYICAILATVAGARQCHNRKTRLSGVIEVAIWRRAKRDPAARLPQHHARVRGRLQRRQRCRLGLRAKAGELLRDMEKAKPRGSNQLGREQILMPRASKGWRIGSDRPGIRGMSAKGKE